MIAQSQRPPRVLVFDSGVGSLSIGGEIHRLLPDIDILYVMDRGGFPYGEYPEQQLVPHICQAILGVLATEDVDIAVVACNSASTTVLPALRAQTDTPIVGVVPAVKPAAASTKSAVIGLLATPGTITRSYTHQLINDFAKHCEVIAIGSPKLAPAIENWYWRGELDQQVLADIADEFHQHPHGDKLDTMVLACTHFPLVRGELGNFFGEIEWVDSGSAIAKRVAQLLLEHNITRQPKHSGQQAVRILGQEHASKPLTQRLQQQKILIQ